MGRDAACNRFLQNKTAPLITLDILVSQDLYIDTARILIIEESALLRQMSVNMVEELGLIAQSVATVEEAIWRLTERNFDIVLLEVKAPERTAVARVEAMRRAISSMHEKKVPLVAMSAGVKRGPLLGAGADDILMRPFMVGELEALIDRWLSPGAIV